MAKWTPIQALDPTKVKAVITTRWAGTAYKSTTIRRVESYSVSSNLDTDADSWTLEIGNPDADLNPVLVRDNEVRVQVFGAGATQQVPICVGIMDDVTYTEQGTLQLSGRDMSAIAVDSDHFPILYRGLSPTKIVEQEAREIRCATKFQISPIYGGPKRQMTDGSEKYWEFWYRLVRKDGMWIWMLADGTLVVSKLNYNDPPAYHFVSKTAKDPKNAGVAVESVNWHKTTQTRIGKLGIEWRTQTVVDQKKPSISIFGDRLNTQWLKRPNKIIQDKHVISKQTAYKSAVEELFESRVGAIEITLTVQDPGFMIRQNRMATVDIPELGLKGSWFVVGSTMRGDSSGFAQDVRLREKKFAISKRFPDDPIWFKDTDPSLPPDALPSGKAAKDILGLMGEHGAEYYQCFLEAATASHGGFALDLFMAVLLAICEHETNFQNIRSVQMANDAGTSHIDAPGEHYVEWYDIRKKQNVTPTERDNWYRNFSNRGGDNYIPSGYRCAVGPMQVFTESFKEECDRRHGGKVDEYFGNRWVPCDNIKEGAAILAEKTKAADLQHPTEADLWRGVCNYGGQGLDANGMCGYSYDIKYRVETSPGWLALVQAAINSSTSATGSNTGGGTGSAGSSDELPPAGGCNMEAAAWAQKVLDRVKQDKINFDHSEDLRDIQRAAQGQNTGDPHHACMDARVMATMVAIADKWGKMRSYSVCSSHSPDNWGGHSRGYAFDLNGVGGIAFDGSYNLDAKNRDIEVLQWLTEYGAPDIRLIANNVGNVHICDPEITKYCIPPLDRWSLPDPCGDHSNHIHVCYTPGVPTS